MSRRTRLLSVLALLMLVWAWLTQRSVTASRSAARVPATPVVAARYLQPSAAHKEPTTVLVSADKTLAKAPSPDSSASFAVLPIGTRALHRVWVRARFGRRAEDLGLDYLGGGGELYPPQGFVPTPEGNLLVLDSNKKRLVEYDPAGHMGRVIPVDLVMPADVAVAKDGTIIVVDHPGLQTKGILLLNPDGTKRRELARIQHDFMQAMYTVGNDFYFDLGMEGSVKGGDTSGSLSDETPGVYNYPDQELVPGNVAPDGRTVIALGAELEGLELGEFFVSAVRDEPPVHLFTHRFIWPKPLAGVCWAGADPQGNIYAVVLDERRPQRDMLVCLDPQGRPVGTADMGHSDGSVGTQLRRYNVVPGGGLVFQRLHEQGISYEWYDCH